MDATNLYEQLKSAQQDRLQLLRWKLLIIAGVGAPALGFASYNVTGSHLALAIIPLACLYVDILCRELSVRSKRIGRFLAHHQNDDEMARAFETYYKATKKGASLESFALVSSTVTASILVFLIGMVKSIKTLCPFTFDILGMVVFVLSFFVGLVGSWVVHRRYRNRLRIIDEYRSVDEACVNHSV